MNEIKKILSYFDILGVPYFSDYQTVKSTFRKKIKELHPDIKKTKDNKEARELISAYKSLQTLYNNKDLLEYYKRELLKVEKIKRSPNIHFSLKEIKEFLSKHYGLILKGLILIVTLVIPTLIFDNLINIILFIIAVVGIYFTLTKL